MSDKRLHNYKKNDILSLDVTDLNNLGAGVAHTDEGLTVFIKGAVSGDRVEAKIIKVSQSYLVARLERIISPSPDRIDGHKACKAPTSCGGCCYRDIKYEKELELKRDYVKNAFRKAGLFDVEVEDTVSNGNISGYRNKGQYPVRQTAKGLRAGFFASKTHDLIPSERCMLQPEIFSEIVKFVIDFAERKKVSAYDEQSGKGILRHIYLRRAWVTGEIMLCLVINASEMPYEDELAESVMARFPSVVSVMVNENRKNTNVVLGKRFYCVGGKGYIEDILCGVRLRISAGAFYQVNHDMAEILYRLAAERASLSDGSVIADLYCGTGSIGLSMASWVKKLVGVEIVEEAVECARINAEINGIENASFYCGDASDTRGLLSEAISELSGRIPDTVIIDPPRKGSTEELIDYITDLGVGRVVYVSCDPDTLARDCAYFRKCGFEIGRVTPVDLFPRTGHVETIVCLCKQ